MGFWQRLGVTMIVVLAAGFILGLLWQAAFNARLPSYLAGLAGGLAAIPVWEFLKRVSIKSKTS